MRFGTDRLVYVVFLGAKGLVHVDEALGNGRSCDSLWGGQSGILIHSDLFKVGDSA